jgi:hypothetical protein
MWPYFGCVEIWLVPTSIGSMSPRKSLPFRNWRGSLFGSPPDSQEQMRLSLGQPAQIFGGPCCAIHSSFPSARNGIAALNDITELLGLRRVIGVGRNRRGWDATVGRSRSFAV